MERQKPKKAFSLAHDPKKQIADKDNAQTKPKPPMHIQHPRLAPPGMGGVKPSPTTGLTLGQASRPKLKRELGKSSDVHREFKGLAQPGKELGRDR